MPHDSDTLDTPTFKIQIYTLAHESDIRECSDQNSIPKINRLYWQNHEDRQLISTPYQGKIQLIEQLISLFGTTLGASRAAIPA